MEDRDSLLPLQHLLEEWSAGARDREIERLIVTLKEELHRRGYEIRCEGPRRSS